MEKPRIMIVEDESIIALDIQNILALEGYEISGIAETGEDAVRMAEKTVPDLILMDIVLKGPMDGIEASRIIRTARDIPVIYLTANADSSTVDRARDTQPYGYLNKPVSGRDLNTNIDSALHLTRMERHIRESEEKYRELFELESDAIFMVEGRSGMILEANRAASALYGYSREELLQMNISALSTEAGKTARELREKVSVLSLCRHRGKTGNVFTTESTARHLDWQGRLVHILAVRNVSERIQAQEALKAQRDMAQLYLDIVGVIIVAIDRGGRVILINRKGREVLGYREDEIIGRDWFSSFIPERNREAVLKVFKTILAGGTEHMEYYENSVRISSGAERMIAWHNTVIKDENGAIMSIISSGEDITERKKREDLIIRQKDELKAANDEMQAAYEELQASNEEFETINEELTAANARLAESEEIFRKLIEKSPFPIAINNLEGKIEFINTLFIETFGYTLQDCPDLEAWFSLAYPDREYRARVQSEWYAHVEGYRTGSPEIIPQVANVTCSDGSVRVVEFRYIIAQKKGICFFYDITEREHAAEMLKQSEKRYRSLFEGMPIGLYRTTPEGRIIDANISLASILGYRDNGSILNVHTKDLYLNTNDRERFMEMLRKQKTARDFETRLRRQDGKIIWVRNNGRSVQDANGRILFFEGSIEDITEQKTAEEAIHTSEANYRAIFDNANDAIFIHDTATGAILDVNRKMTEMYGYSTDEAKRIEVNTLSSGEKPYSQEEALMWIRKAVSEGPQIFEWRARNKAGGLFWVEVSLKRVNIEGSDRLMAIVRDISERKSAEEEKKRLEEQFRQSQKMESIGQLAGGIAHDFNNLLTAVTGNIALAQMNLPGPETVKRHLEEAARAVDSAAGLIRQLLAFSRKQIIQPQVVDLNYLISEMERLLVRIIGEDIELHITMCEEPAMVKIDPGQFEQIIVNLAVNARDAMPGGGRLTIETSVLEPGDEYRRNHADVPPGRSAMISISDTGSGMSDSVKMHLFEPFFTTKPPGKGTGLGLSTVFGSVKQSGGSIEVCSTEGSGTAFLIYLPVTSENPAASASAQSAQDLPAGTETILLVEDEDGVRKLVVTHLQRLGYTVMEYPGGPEAITAAGSHAGPIHLLITDVVMPGMSGIELAQHISEIIPGIKILFTSGYTVEDIHHQGTLEKGVQFLSKPFTPLKLARKVREILDE